MMDDQTLTLLCQILTDIATDFTHLQARFRELKQLSDDSDEVIVKPHTKEWLETEIGNLKELLKDLE